MEEDLLTVVWRKIWNSRVSVALWCTADTYIFFNVLNYCTVRDIEYETSNCLPGLYWRSFSMVRIKGLYDAWKCRILGDLQVFWESGITIRVAADKYVKCSIRGWCPWFLRLLTCIGDLLTRYVAQSIYVHVYWWWPVRRIVISISRRFVLLPRSNCLRDSLGFLEYCWVVIWFRVGRDCYWCWVPLCHLSLRWENSAHKAYEGRTE